MHIAHQPEFDDVEADLRVYNLAQRSIHSFEQLGVGAFNLPDGLLGGVLRGYRATFAPLEFTALT